ncbi:MAG TPA: hypothetical protein VF194_15330 [Ferrovibrio sp.]|uniref:hypothetical protein n=1 Tax=Ferrovibrio sp. TaxID=1917215 RepID=UPI002ED1CD5D
MNFDQGLLPTDPDGAAHAESAAIPADAVIDVEIEPIGEAGRRIDDDPAAAKAKALLGTIGDRFNTETRFHDLSLSQLAVRSLWIVDYLRQLGETEMADGDLDSIGRCADDLENAIILMFQLAGGTSQELRQRYHDIIRAMRAAQHGTIDQTRPQ